MNRTALLLLLSPFLVASVAPATTAVADDDPAAAGGQLSVPWDEFKKLLNLDEDQIVLSIDAFQKLLAQVSPDSAPEYTVQGGSVTLARQAFNQLINSMQPPVRTGAKPPFSYLMTKAVYSGTMDRRNTAFTATFNVHVLEPGVYLKIPILPQSIALEDVIVDEQQALVVREHGYHNVVLSIPGEHVVVASFSLRSSLEQGPHKIDLAVQETPITLLRLDLPLNGIEVEIPQAQQLVTTPTDGGTIVSATLAPGRQISVQWRDQVAVAEKVPPKLYSEVHQVVSIEDDVLTISSDFSYNILHSEVDNISLAVPADMNVLSVTGEGLGEWQELAGGDERRIVVPFTYGRKGRVHVSVVTEKPFSGDTRATVLTGLRAFDTVRETGFIGVEVKTSAEVTITDSEGLEPVAVQKLPQTLQQRAVKPLLHGFKYLKHPYRLVLSIRKHDKVDVPIAAITSANAVTLVTEDGKVVHRLLYQVRNSAKQFLQLRLPANADIWTVFVDGQPVESAINGDGKLLVPLIRSRVAGNALSDFPVEVVYCLVEDRFTPFGDQHAGLPAVDLLTSQLIWSVYLPDGYTYVHFSSTLEKEKMIRGLNVLTGAQRKYDDRAMKEIYDAHDDDGEQLGASARLRDVYKGDYASEFQNLPLGDKQMSSQVAAELEFGRRLEGLARQPAAVSGVAGAGHGVFPIQIQVPTGGQVYRFAKTIIKTEDPLTVTATYSTNWLVRMARWGFAALLLWVVYLNRKTLAGLLRRLTGKIEVFVELCRRHEKAATTVAQSIMTPVVLFGLLAPSWLFAPRLTVVILFFFWLSVTYQIVLFGRRRVRARAAARTQHESPTEDRPDDAI